MHIVVEREIIMQKVKCPHCGEGFVVEYLDYSQIVQQVRNC